MPVMYTNRKGRTYYLCKRFSNTGKPYYFFTREAGDNLVDKIPEGYAISESVNGVVSLTKARPILLSEREIECVKTALQRHPQARKYRIDIKPKHITIYEQTTPDLQELIKMIEAELGPAHFAREHFVRSAEDYEADAQFTPVLRLVVTNKEKRRFKGQRMCHFGDVEGWIEIDSDKSIAELTSALIPILGTDEFYELI